MRAKSLMSVGVLAASVVLALVVSGCGGGGASGSTSAGRSFQGAPINGAGATFPSPVYAQWAKSFTQVEPDAQVNYQAIGSGGGIEQFTAKTVDFGATDVPLKADEAAKINGGYVEFPTCLGAVVVSYNLPSLKEPLELDGKTIADIFLGKIRKWNDAAIAALNPGVILPPTPIQVVRRADGSGTTNIFTNWLTAGSPDWAKKVGAGKSVQWPVGQGGNGNAGVAQVMKQTEGSIGYLELQYVFSSGLGMSAIKAPDGSFVAPSAESVAKAASGLTFPITEKTNILNSTAAGAYPISSTTYILVYTDQPNKDKAQTVVDFWTWALMKGQSELGPLNYAPLPGSVQQEAVAQLGKIESGGKPVTPSPGVK